VWETSFLAVSVLLGEDIGDALASLGPDGAARAAALADKLRDPRKLARAQALAAEAQAIAREVAEVTLR
jgi:hypothetical protein